MTTKIAAVIFLGSVMLIRADQLVERVQQALKDQGFYYGQVTGEMNANVTAAIRRYQIRSGLQVSGQLNAETLQSLGLDSSAAARPVTKAAPPAPAATATPSDQSQASTGNVSPAPPVQPFGNAPQDQQVYPSNPVMPGASPGGVLAGTPFEAAPPGVQRNVVFSAQIALARRGLYHDEINGVYGPAMEFSLRAYQSRARLPVTGRLDLETLAALQLLPGGRAPMFHPPRRRARPGPPVRGEWVPE
jgi:peptidoglycan hydrolase-like protein with peptidoglycan-binding domain